MLLQFVKIGVSLKVVRSWATMCGLRESTWNWPYAISSGIVV